MTHVPQCASCGTTDCPLFFCKQCNLVSYCGKQCQKTDWHCSHKNVCTKKNAKMYAEVQIRTVQPTTGEANMQSLRALLLKNKGADSQYLSIFRALDHEQRNKEIAIIAIASKKARKGKNGMTDTSERWAAVFATSQLAILCMLNHEWTAARKRVVEFFALLELFNATECSEMQRDLWEVDNYTACMQKNLEVLDGILMEAEDIIVRKQVFELPSGIDKTTRAYALMHRVQTSQDKQDKLGAEFAMLNFHSRMETVISTVSLLVDMSFDTANEINLAIHFKFIDQQMALGFRMFGTDHSAHDKHVEQLSVLKRLVGVVKRMKMRTLFSTSLYLN